jgi:DNA-binding transcriptional LysR family regulator
MLQKNMAMQNLGRIDLALLVLFEALLAERNVTRAALRVGVAQPSASKALDRLRNLFADPLFVRVGGGMRPTPRAIELAPEISVILERVRSLVADEVPFRPADAQGEVRLAMSDAAEFVLLPGLLAMLSRQAPGVTLRARPLDKDRGLADLGEGRLDAIVGVFPDLPKSLRFAPLFEERFVCLARAGHSRLRRGLTLEAYVELPHLLVTLRDDLRGAVDEALTQVGRTRRVQATLGRFIALPAILAQTDAVATVPSRFATHATGCEVFDPPVPLAGWTEKLVWLSGNEREPLTAWIIEAVKTVTAALPPLVPQKARRR